MRTALKTNETVLITIRQHWLKLLLPLLAWLLLAILLFWFAQTLTAFIVVVVTAAYPLVEYVKWKHNIWCVTNLRVVEESGFFTRYSKESPLDKINNVEYDQTFWGRLIGFGTVDIQTAAELGETVHELIHHPKKLKDTITLAQEDYKEMQSTKHASLLAAAIAKTTAPAATSQQFIAAEIEQLFSLMQKGAITQEEFTAQKNKLLEK